MIAELSQRTIEIYSPSVAAVRSRLLEGRQNHGSARALKRLDKCLV
jgi:hypothetical protein